MRDEIVEGRQVERSVLYLGSRDIIMVAGSANSIIIYTFMSIISVSLIISNIYLDGINFTIVFLPVFYAVIVLVFGATSVASHTMVVTTVCLAIMTATVAGFVNYKFDFRYTDFVAVPLTIIFFVFSTSWRFCF